MKRLTTRLDRQATGAQLERLVLFDGEPIGKVTQVRTVRPRRWLAFELVPAGEFDSFPCAWGSTPLNAARYVLSNLFIIPESSTRKPARLSKGPGPRSRLPTPY
jgi:hypothetical protein